MIRITRSQGVLVGVCLALLGVALWVVLGGVSGGWADRERALIGLLRDADPGVRRAAASGLATIGSAAARAPLREQVGVETDADARIALAWALWRLGDADGARPALAAALADADPARRLVAVGALRRIERPDAATLLVGALGDSAAGVRTEAALGLVRIDHQAGFDALEACLHDARPEHRLGGARALARVDDPRAVALARRAAGGDDPIAAGLGEVVLDGWGDAEGAGLPGAARALDAGGEGRRMVCEALRHVARSEAAKALEAARCR